MIHGKKRALFAGLLCLLLLLAGCARTPAPSPTPTPAPAIVTPSAAATVAPAITASPTATPSAAPTLAPTVAPTADPNLLKVHIIDVGKADCILIQLGQQAMLVDAGTPEAAQTALSYLNQQGIDRFEYIIATHTDRDHIGGMPDVLRAFPVGKFFLPDVPDDREPNLLLQKALGELGIKPIRPKVGSSYRLGGAEFVILAPKHAKYRDFNNYSVVIRLIYGQTSFLLEADALKESEKEMLASGLRLQSDLLKVAHHGGNDSTTAAFLKAVKPKYAVISVDDSRNGYPSDKVLERLAKAGVLVYSTDMSGTIVATSDGKTVTLDQSPIVLPTEKPKK